MESLTSVAKIRVAKDVVNAQRQVREAMSAQEAALKCVAEAEAKVTSMLSLLHDFLEEFQRLWSSFQEAAEGFHAIGLRLHDVLLDGGRDWFPEPSLSVDCGPEHLLPGFTRLVEHLEAFRSAVDAAVLQEVCDLA